MSQYFELVLSTYNVWVSMCMCMCVYVCMYVCMYVRTYGYYTQTRAVLKICECVCVCELRHKLSKRIHTIYHTYTYIESKTYIYIERDR
jgi:hypothetical protein